MATETTYRRAEAPRRSWFWPILLLVIIVVAGAWGYYATRPTPAQVVERDIIGLIPLNGEILVPPNARADVPPPYKAQVEKVEVSVGQKVSRGDTLIKLNLPDVKATIEEARANMKAAETAYANAAKQYDSSISAARSQLKNPPSTTITPENPGEPGQSTSTTSTDTAAAQSNLQAAIAGRDAAVAPFKQQLDAARAAYEEARSGGKIAYVRAPLAGTVLTLNAQPGTEIGQDRRVPVATIVDLTKLQVQADMSAQQAGAVKRGQEVVLRFVEIPGKELKAKIRDITTRVDSKIGGLMKSQVYVALIEFDNDRGEVKPGMKLQQCAVKTGETRNALAVPNEAVDTDSSGRPTVKVMRGGQWQVVTVQTGVSDGQYTEVKSGLQKGETVQVTPNLLHAAPLPGR